MIQNKQYIKKFKPNFNIKQFSIITWTILINLLLFIIKELIEVWFSSNIIIDYLSFSATNLFNGRLWTIITYSLIHSNLIHLSFNIITLFFIGNRCQKAFGNQIFITAYIISPIIGSLIWFFINLNNPSNLLLGSSVVIFSLLTYFCLENINQKIHIILFFLIPITIRTKWIMFSFFILELFSFLIYELPGYTITSHSVNLGGMLSGLIIFKLFNFKNYLLIKKDYNQFINKEKNRILDKINLYGFGSLTKKEKNTLDQNKNCF